MATKAKATETTTVEQSKFLNVLGKNVKEIKGARAVIIGEDAEAAASTLVRDLKDNLRKLRSRLLTLEDINANAAFTTNPVKENFDAGAWIRQMHSLRLEILDTEIELDMAEKIYDEWFTIKE